MLRRTRSALSCEGTVKNGTAKERKARRREENDEEKMRRWPAVIRPLSFSSLLLAFLSFAVPFFIVPSQLNALRVLRSIHFRASQILRSFLRSSYSRQFMFLVCQLFLGSLCREWERAYCRKEKLHMKSIKGSLSRI